MPRIHLTEHSLQGLGLRMATLFLCAVLGGILFNTLRPAGGLAWYTAWSTHVEARALEAGIPVIDAPALYAALPESAFLLLDARPETDYHRGHLPGAIALPWQELDAAFLEVQLFLFPEQPLVTYCSGLACDEALLLAEFLYDQGYTNVMLFAGGLEAWLAANLPLEGARSR